MNGIGKTGSHCNRFSLRGIVQAKRATIGHMQAPRQGQLAIWPEEPVRLCPIRWHSTVYLLSAPGTRLAPPWKSP